MQVNAVQWGSLPEGHGLNSANPADGVLLEGQDKMTLSSADPAMCQQVTRHNIR